ncbi:MAG: hypothetical protein DSZ05_02870 [Sulfurospirillum sp.]|nr:MAG: hypothetical protein DSZ05_02870 [Sulfurospirillum sp.]
MKTIHELYVNDKPREKIVQKGVKALKNDELLAVLLGSGVKGKDIRKLSREVSDLLEKNFENLSVEKLCQIHGLGIAKASQIVAALELSKRLLSPNPRRIISAKMVYEALYAFRDKKQEHFVVLTLDGASHIINIRTVFIGTLTQSIVHPREVFADAIADRAASIIIAHNHPSGTLRASQADIRITERLKEVGSLVGIELLDHVIISHTGYYSFSDEGML